MILSRMSAVSVVGKDVGEGRAQDKILFSGRYAVSLLPRLLTALP